MNALQWGASPAEIGIALGMALVVWVAVAALELWPRSPAPALAGERQRLPRRRTGAPARLLLLAVALFALVVLVARPVRLVVTGRGDAVLLTPGASAGDLAAAAAAGLPAWGLPPAPGEPPLPAGAPELPDAAGLVRLHPEASRLRVAGFGLSRWELAELSLPVVAPRPPALPFGLARAAWPRRLPLGAPFEVHGQIAGAPAGGATVRLAGPPLEAVAARLPAGSSPFVLRATPRGPGRHLLELRLEAAGRRPANAQLDVEVVAEAPPAVLWLDEAPTPEGRELKRWLSAAGAPFAWRAQPTRGVTRGEVVGVPGLAGSALTSLTPGLLRRFDLAVASPRALAALGGGERAALDTAVRDGLGLLLRAGRENDPVALGVRFAARPLPGGGELAAHIAWRDGESAALPLPARELAPAADLLPLASDRGGRLLAAWRPLGGGALGVTLVDDSWRWVLEGHAADHRRLWRETITALARPAAVPPRWEVPPGPLLVDAPVTATITGVEGAPPAATVRDPAGRLLPLAPRQDADELSRWSVTFWPRQTGWYAVGEGAAASALWVASASAWTVWRLAGREEATAARMAAPSVATPTRELVRRPLPLPRWPPFLLLLAALLGLWIADRGEGPAAAAPRPRS
ncbi:MAG TPA: hypothetical protein VGV61_03725 [Thermoanaerobaculia bacterium]|nr:hypothetical protein [Thermoanaerobaculia bacterium]